MSRAMLERYSHVRLSAKREAVEAMTTETKPTVRVHASTIPTTVNDSARVQ